MTSTTEADVADWLEQQLSIGSSDDGVNDYPYTVHTGPGWFGVDSGL